MENLTEIYGENVLEQLQFEIKRLDVNSNISFNKLYVEIGVTFLQLKAQQIVKGEKEKLSLRSLVSESFGKAAIYKYNIKGDN